MSTPESVGDDGGSYSEPAPAPRGSPHCAAALLVHLESPPCNGSPALRFLPSWLRRVPRVGPLPGLTTLARIWHRGPQVAVYGRCQPDTNLARGLPYEPGSV